MSYDIDIHKPIKRRKPPIMWPVSVRRAMRLRLRKQMRYPLAGRNDYENSRCRVGSRNDQMAVAKRYFASADCVW